MIEKALIGGLFITVIYFTDKLYKDQVNDDKTDNKKITTSQFGHLLDEGFAFIVVFYIYTLWFVHSISVLRNKEASENKRLVK